MPNSRTPSIAPSRKQAWHTWVCVALLASTLTACNTFKKEPPVSSTNSVQALAPIWLKQVWDGINAMPTALENDARLLVAQGNVVSSYASATGAVEWQAKIGRVQAPLAVSDDEKVAIALVKGIEAVGLDTATGAILWRTPLPAVMRARPVYVAGVFVVLTTDGRVVGIHAATGGRKWTLSRPVPTLSLNGSGALTALSGSTALIGLPGGKALAVNVLTGKPQWETPMALTRGVNDIEQIADVLPHWITVPELGACATIYQQRAVCINDQGRMTHQHIMNATTGLAIDDGRWLALGESGTLKSWAFNVSNVNSYFDVLSPELAADWSFEGLQGGAVGHGFAPFSAMAVAHGHVFVVDTQRVLHVLASKTGKTLAQGALRGSSKETVALSPITIAGKHSVLVVTDKQLSIWSVK
jgi:outer membrane protein assembly factor BamB